MNRQILYFILLTTIWSCHAQHNKPTTKADLSAIRYEAINRQLDTHNDCIICDSTQVFKTVEDILALNRFKNKVVYLDFWGTGCSPCIEEFEFLPELKRRFKNQPVEYLYIITYDEKKEWDTYRPMKWRMIIKKHKLAGINMLVSRNLKHRFIYKYKDQTDPVKMYAVPKYILFDKNGQVVDFNAPRPSSKEVLYGKIQELLNE